MLFRKHTFASLCIGVLLYSLCLLVLEILLVRILSAIFYYHLVFFVVSLVMFGLTAGGMLVYFHPQFFPQERIFQRMALVTALTSLSVIFSFFSLFWLPAVLELWQLGPCVVPALFLILSLPFLCFGIVLALSLSRFSEITAKIYGFNLIGSALGCLGIVFLLGIFNAAALVFLIALLLLLVALIFFCLGQDVPPRLLALWGVLSLVFLGLSLNANMNNIPYLLYTKGLLNRRPPLYDEWNFHSHVRLTMPGRSPFGWGFSDKVASLNISIEELMIAIDDDAGTVLTKFNDISDLEYLKYDVTSIAYVLGRLDDVLVLGAGGGRDTLTAALFGAKNITGVEINKAVYDIAFDKFGDFTAGIKKYPQIRLVVGEGRSYVLSSGKQYDVIQVSLVDSFAAMASGAFALTENSLYSTDAWVNFLGHLKERGILTFSVWFLDEDPKYMYRLLNVAKKALRSIGIDDIRSHMVLARNQTSLKQFRVGTLLVSKSPFSRLDVQALERSCKERDFEIVLSPFESKDETIVDLLRTSSDKELLDRFVWDLRPPDDNRPFFFYFAKIKDIFSLRGDVPPEARTLRSLFVAILSFGVFGIFVPVLRRARKVSQGDFSPGSASYFFWVGLGFMFVELALMQRLGLFLGHPVYGMTVVLFSLLFFSGIGSMIAGSMKDRRAILLIFSIFLAVLLLLGSLLPALLRSLMPASMQIKILSLLAILIVTGFFMGMPFPIGLRLMAESKSSKALYWSINGFASMCGSALSTIILIHFGFKDAFLFSFICYALAFVFLFLSSRNRGCVPSDR